MYAALKVMKHRLPADNSDASYYHKLCCIIKEELQVIFTLIVIKWKIIFLFFY